jgi:hypothetical protein
MVMRSDKQPGGKQPSKKKLNKKEPRPEQDPATDKASDHQKENKAPETEPQVQVQCEDDTEPVSSQTVSSQGKKAEKETEAPLILSEEQAKTMVEWIQNNPSFYKNSNKAFRNNETKKDLWQEKARVLRGMGSSTKQRCLDLVPRGRLIRKNGSAKDCVLVTHICKHHVKTSDGLETVLAVSKQPAPASDKDDYEQLHLDVEQTSPTPPPLPSLTPTSNQQSAARQTQGSFSTIQKHSK